MNDLNKDFLIGKLIQKNISTEQINNFSVNNYKCVLDIERYKKLNVDTGNTDNYYIIKNINEVKKLAIYLYKLPYKFNILLYENTSEGFLLYKCSYGANLYNRDTLIMFSIVLLNDDPFPIMHFSYDINLDKFSYDSYYPDEEGTYLHVLNLFNPDISLDEYYFKSKMEYELIIKPIE